MTTGKLVGITTSAVGGQAHVRKQALDRFNLRWTTGGRRDQRVDAQRLGE